MHERSPKRMSPARNAARGVALNLAGAVIPAALGLLTLPLLAAGLGTERLGILTLAWALLGYLGLLHLGVGRALTHAAAGGDHPELPSLAWTGVLITGVAGVIAGAALVVAAPFVVGWLKVDAGMRREAAAAFRLLALALPFTVGAPAWTGLLEARGRWGRLNVVSTLVSVASYLGPLAAMSAGARLPGVVGVLTAARVVAWMAYVALCLREFPSLRRGGRPERGRAGELLRFGGWTTVSAVISPLMTSLDRFVVAGAVSASSVAFYAAPQEVILRLGAVSGAVVAVLFPLFAAAQADGRAVLARVLERGTEAVFVLVFPLSLLMTLFAREGLGRWLGAEYARNGAVVLAWLAAGLLANGLGKPPAALVQGVGRPDLSARIHMAELPVYVAVLAGLVWGWGIAGAAAAWLARAAGDAVAMHWAAGRLVPSAAGRRAAVLGALGLGALGVAAALGPLSARIGWGTAALAAAGIYAARRFTPAAGGRKSPAGTSG